MQGLLVAGLLATLTSPLAAQELDPITIIKQGAIAVGGTEIVNEDGETQSCDHGYLEFQIPADDRATGLFLWHSSSTYVWQQNWVGEDGFQSIFLRRGYPIFLWDGPRVGRSNWGCAEQTYAPVAGRDQQNFTSWRFGPSWLRWFDDVQFPRNNRDALNMAMRARYNEFDTIENAQLEARTAAQFFEMFNNSPDTNIVAVTSSAGGLRALLAATQTDGIAAIVAYENPGYLFPEGEGPGTPESPFGPLHVSEEEFERLLTIPMQFVWGDNIEKHTIWSAKLEECRQFVELINARGGKAEILMLEDEGLTGNTHMPFADLNNVEVAALLDEFLARHGLDSR